MKAAARALGASSLRGTSSAELMKAAQKLRPTVGDRALLRAIHFFSDNERVAFQVEALEKADFVRFLRLVNESGRSSWMLLQNVYAPERPEEQSLSLALALTEQILGGRGACRVHGGGFAGTILVFVPDDLTGEYVEKMDEVFGRGATKILHIRSIGACEVLTECPFSGVGR
jgi:galactokinase